MYYSKFEMGWQPGFALKKIFFFEPVKFRSPKLEHFKIKKISKSSAIAVNFENVYYITTYIRYSLYTKLPLP